MGVRKQAFILGIPVTLLAGVVLYNQQQKTTGEPDRFGTFISQTLPPGTETVLGKVSQNIEQSSGLSGEFTTNYVTLQNNNGTFNITCGFIQKTDGAAFQLYQTGNSSTLTGTKLELSSDFNGLRVFYPQPSPNAFPNLITPSLIEAMALQLKQQFAECALLLQQIVQPFADHPKTDPVSLKLKTYDRT